MITADVNRRSIFFNWERANALAVFLNAHEETTLYHVAECADGGWAIVRYHPTKWVRMDGSVPAEDEGWSKST